MRWYSLYAIGICIMYLRNIGYTCICLWKARHTTSRLLTFSIIIRSFKIIGYNIILWYEYYEVHRNFGGNIILNVSHTCFVCFSSHVFNNTKVYRENSTGTTRETNEFTIYVGSRYLLHIYNRRFIITICAV